MPSQSGPVADAYAPTAAAYDLVNAAARVAQRRAVQAWLPHLRPQAGPVLDIGAGSGLILADSRAGA
ncbi:hypothetical protein [Kineosporia sp. NBRC 101731]|uniref:hypothetical protein n=1 Tax=Kineosporia sp. NBRC 101731 TaxID=3032199 RepID=UPI0024A03304|nr:hypothetical protein [Kineosporia sp. NBRC 101731]GLY32375.1 hypothetical protein Kisp02_57400 [Kineosporia sp. NBRC 101731]